MENNILKIDLSDVKVGDEVFDSACGYTKVANICSNNKYQIEIETLSFRFDGVFESSHTRPRLFHSLKECRDYWESVYKAEQDKPKKPYYRLIPKEGVNVPDEIKRLAESQINDGRELNAYSTPVRSVSSMFGWKSQPEGEDYWALIHKLFTVEKD